MNNEVRKRPREFWICPSPSGYDDEICEVSSKDKWNPGADGWVFVREVLPGDDSLRVSRSDLNQLIETLISKSDSRYEGRIRQSFKGSYQHWLKRIERENPPKQDEGK